MTPQQRAELERSSQLFHIAMLQLGIQAVGDTLSLWQDVPPMPTNGAPNATERWLATAVTYVMRRRIRARDLALAYYRYTRAVATGTTIAPPGTKPLEYESLFRLKTEFENLLSGGSSAPQSTNETQAVSQAGTADVSASQAPSTPPEPSDPSDRILVEEIDGLDAQMAADERIAQMQIEDALKALGPDNMDRKIAANREELQKQIDQLSGSDSLNNLDKSNQDAHTEAGARQAATAAREVMNGARGSLFTMGTKDRRIIGYVRLSRTGTPCGWCAMLISRGFVPKTGSALYKSDQGSGTGPDGTLVTFGDLDLYHDNCQCYAVPIYSRDQLAGEMFALNRHYAELWPKVTNGLGGKSALTAWRHFIRQEAKSHKSQVAAA